MNKIVSLISVSLVSLTLCATQAFAGGLKDSAIRVQCADTENLLRSLKELEWTKVKDQVGAVGLAGDPTRISVWISADKDITLYTAARKDGTTCILLSLVKKGAAK